MLSFTILIPLFSAAAALFLKQKRNIEIFGIAAQSVIVVLSFIIISQVAGGGMILSRDKGLMADALSAYLAAIVSVIGLASLIYSSGYLNKELEANVIFYKQVKRYYAFVHLFIFAMLLALFSDNLALMWIAIEGTTLATAFLINFYNNQKTLEAAWKYLIICTIGISIALLGTILTYYAALQSGANASDVLAWSSLVAFGSRLNPDLLKIAFIFIFVGYGTKVGLAPFHTWLPDAHSRAPSPISALLSGVLLNVALYSILRFKVITDAALGGHNFSNTLFIIFGIISVVMASLIILVAKKYKRLLAYSSIEHMGLIALGIGFGTPLSILGSLWHFMNHALAKSTLFFISGNILLKYHTGSTGKVKGMIKVIPVSAVLFLIGVAVIVGLPPFAPFFSKFFILSGGFSSGNIFVSVAVLLALAVAFAGFFIHANRMFCGNPPTLMKEWGAKPSSPEPEKGEASKIALGLIAFNFLLILAMGVFLPVYLANLFEQIRNILL